jgi:signal peptidase I
MEPTLTIGDNLITDSKYFKKTELQRGDLVIFQYPKDPAKDFIKRVIALEGEKIEIKNKQVYINDEAIPESYKVHKDINVDEAIRDNFGPALVPSDHCFVLGDNRDNSMDSRYWGSIPISNIKAKPLYIYWAKDKNRIGKKIK